MTTLLACDLRADESLQPRNKAVIVGFVDGDPLRPIWGTVQNIVSREGGGQRETRVIDRDLVQAVGGALQTDLDRFLARERFDAPGAA